MSLGGRHATDTERRQAFRSCSNQCQFTSASTVSGNRFKHELKYCYAPIASDDLPLNLSRTVLSEPGMSCTSACHVRGQGCDESFLEAINTCESFATPMADCSTGCRVAESRLAPALVDQECVLNAKPHLLDCDAKRSNVRRLCNCLPNEISPDSVRFNHEDYVPGAGRST